MIDEPSDGVFRFYWSDHEEMEWARGPFDTAEAAKADAIEDFGTCHYGADPGSTIYIVRCDKRLTRAPSFDLLTDGFLNDDFDDAMEALWEKFGDTNEECFGEDGFEGLSGDNAHRAYAALEGSIQMEIVRWRVASDLPSQAALAESLKAAFIVWQDLYRANIKTWTFGKVEDVEDFTLPTFGSEQADEDFIHARIAKSLGMTPEDYAATRGAAGMTTTV